MTKSALRLGASFLLFLILPAISQAQNGSILIQPDIRVFTVLAALQTAGLELNSSRPQPMRSAISLDLKGLPPDLKERLEKFCQGHMEGKKAEDQVSKYVSLALFTEGPPDFKLSAADLPPDAKSISEFMGLVREFYIAAKIEVLWSKNREYYDQVVNAYRPLINQIILKTDGYLRVISGSFLDRQLLIIPELLVPPNTFNSRTYRESYYLVFGPSEKVASDEFRHQYLHFLLDPYALRFMLPRETRMALEKFLETAPNIESPYRTDLQFLVTESLIRAIDLRMNKVVEPRASASLDSYIRAGAVLVRHFYDSLQTFEASPEGIRVYYPGMVRSVDMSRVETSFMEAQKTVVVKKAEPSELEKLILEANDQLGNNNLEKAAEQFQSILKTQDPNNGEALHGLGVIAIIQNERETAKNYFLKALQSVSTNNSIKVWSHIYLGRIYDVEDNREDAVQQYQFAIILGDNTRNAQEIAQRGLKEAFSPKKRSSSP